MIRSERIWMTTNQTIRARRKGWNVGIMMMMMIMMMFRVRGHEEMRGRTPLPCKAFFKCGPCVSRRSCGWCASSRRCVEGIQTGPIYADEETCESKDWFYESCERPQCRKFETCATCLERGSLCGWCDMGKGTGRCVGGSMMGPTRAIPNRDHREDRLTPYDRCGTEPEPLNGFNKAWRHADGTMCPREEVTPTSVEALAPRRQNVTIGITLEHLKKVLRARQELGIRNSISQVLSFPRKRTRVFVSGVNREDDDKSGVAGNTYRVDIECTLLNVDEKEAKRAIKTLNEAVEKGLLDKAFESRKLKIKTRTVHTVPLLSTGSLSNHSTSPTWPLPPMELVLDPLWDVEEEPNATTTPAPLESIHALSDHPHRSATKPARFRSQQRTALSVNRQDMLHILRKQFDAVRTAHIGGVDALDETQRAMLEENFQVLKACIEDGGNAQDCLSAGST